jgi:hypothetical protein
VSDRDDPWYRSNPAKTLLRRQHLGLEAKGAADVYEKTMMLRPDGSMPDERTRDGLGWHRVTLRVRDGRTIVRLVRELLDAGELIRLQDGRLTSPDVQRELAWRRRRAKPESDEGQGGGSTGGTPQLPFQVIEGGRSSPQQPVDTPVEKQGTEFETPASRPQVARLAANSGLKTQRNQWATPLIRESEKIHEVVVACTWHPRARGHPLTHPP